jgi:microcystin-dependent protein
MGDFTKFILRQGLEADRTKAIYSQGEPIYITDYKRLFLGDGATAGGNIVTNKFLGIASFNLNTNATGVVSAYQGDLVYDTTSSNLYALTGSDPANLLSYVRLNRNYVVDDSTLFIDGSNQMAVKAEGLSFVNLKNDSIGRGLEKIDGGYTLRLNTPNDELEFRDNKLGIANNGVTNAMLDTMGGNTIKGNLGAVGNAEDITLNDLAAALGPILSVGSNSNKFGVPFGTIIDFAGTLVPDGYLDCNGQSYTTTLYPELFNVITYTWGGSGSNFNVPDLRRKTTMGSGGTSTTTIENFVGSVGGTENVSLNKSNIPSHRHSFDAVVEGGNQTLADGGNLKLDTSYTDNGVADGLNEGTLGQPVNNIQPSAVVRKCIRAF